MTNEPLTSQRPFLTNVKLFQNFIDVAKYSDGSRDDVFLNRMTTFIKKIISFAQVIPNFSQVRFCFFFIFISIESKAYFCIINFQLPDVDQIQLLHNCWIEFTLLQMVRGYDQQRKRLSFPSGQFITRQECESNSILFGQVLLPIFDFAECWTRLSPNDVETSFIAAILLLNQGNFFNRKSFSNIFISL